VILDLEDAVSPAGKALARDFVVDWLQRGGLAKAAHIQVRVNSVDTPWGHEDLNALPTDVSVRLPKVESVEDVAAVGGRAVHAILESALGVERAYQIASHPGVHAVGLGEADLAADLGVSDESALAWVRTRVVVAARAAGLPAPMMSVYPQVRDLKGLAASCQVGKALGMRGRAAIHPSQLPVIAAAFAPTEAEVAWAREVTAALDTSGGGVAVLANGDMVDAAMARRAAETLASAQG
jgi:citrate lyase subunit beta/citryl-CoA lyase